MLAGNYAIKQSFALQVTQENKYACNAVFPLIITNFALQPSSDAEPVVVMAEFSNGDEKISKIICCTLNSKFCPQYSTSLVIAAGESVEFSLSRDGKHLL
jgi:hypothetical protein